LGYHFRRHFKRAVGLADLLDLKPLLACVRFPAFRMRNRPLRLADRLSTPEKTTPGVSKGASD
jgi:hypothetical protein